MRNKHGNTKKQLLALLLCLAFLLASCTQNTAEEAEPVVKEQEAEQIEIIIGGDLMCQRRQQREAMQNGRFDFHYQFDYVRELISGADLAIGNLETSISAEHPLSMERKRKYDQPYLNAPEEYLEAVKDCGFDVLVNANNHSCDTGIDGLLETLKKQDEYGFLHTGAFSGKEKNRFLLVEVKGIRIGIVSYAYYYNRSIQEFSGEEIEKHLNYYSQEKAAEDFQHMREAGADFILAFLHSGKEFQFAPTDRQVRMAGEMAELGADYIVGGHSHTVSSFDRIETSDGREVPVVYSLGNFVSNMVYKGKNSDHAMILSLRLEKKAGKAKVADAWYYPAMMLARGKDTGRKDQLVPLTDENIAAFTDQDLVKRMKNVRKTIIRVAGPHGKPVTSEKTRKPGEIQV